MLSSFGGKGKYFICITQVKYTIWTMFKQGDEGRSVLARHRAVRPLRGAQSERKASGERAQNAPSRFRHRRWRSFGAQPTPKRRRRGGRRGGGWLRSVGRRLGGWRGGGWLRFGQSLRAFASGVVVVALRAPPLRPRVAASAVCACGAPSVARRCGRSGVPWRSAPSVCSLSVLGWSPRNTPATVPSPLA